MPTQRVRTKVNNVQEDKVMNEELKERIEVKDLIDEIKILLPDYFECELSSDDNSITFNFYNGQKFIFKATEC